MPEIGTSPQAIRGGDYNLPAIEIRDFGAIKSASIEIAGLTVFIGRNVTAKSYVATVVYALWNSLLRQRRLGRRSFQPGLPLERSPRPAQSVATEFTTLVRRLQTDYKSDSLEVEESYEDGFSVKIAALDDTARQLCDQVFSSMLSASAERFGEELSRCFGSELPPLIRRGKGSGNAVIRWSQPNPLIQTEYELTATGIEGKAGSVNVAGLSLVVPILSSGHRGRPSRAESKVLLELAAREARDRLWVDALATFRPAAHYLPAARSGIMHTHRLAARSWVREIPSFGLQPYEIPTIAGTVTDFLAETVLGDERKKGPLASIAEELEKKVLNGAISVREGRTSYPDVIFREAGEDYPLHLSSSMVSELAPLVLLIRFQLRPGHLLIIEEPESHLHPGAQVELASCIAQLVRAGVRVVVTTHSDFVLAGLNNLLKQGMLRTSQAPDQAKGPYLTQDDIRAYLFKRGLDDLAVEVSRLSILPQLGIPSDQIDEVAENLHENSVLSDRKLGLGAD